MMTLKDLPKIGLLGLLVLVVGLSEASAQLGSRSADDWATVLDREQRVSGLNRPRRPDGFASKSKRGFAK